MKETNEKKKRIIEATIKVLKERPIEEVTMRNIASQAGLTTGALYHHYKNKEELYFAVIQETLHFSNNIYNKLNQNNNETRGKELLDLINKNVSDRLYKIDEQKFHISIISDMLKHRGPIKEKYQDDYKTVITSVGELIIRAFDLEDNPNKVYMANFLIAAIDGMALQQAVNVLPEDLEKIIETFIDFFNVSIPNYLKENKK